VRRPSVETRQILFWALLVARRSGEANVSRNRVLTALLRSTSVAEYCARVSVAPQDAIDATEDPQALPFGECARGIIRDLAQAGLDLGSPEHIATVRPLPLEPAMQNAMQAVLEDRTSRTDVITPLELLVAMMRCDPALASLLALHGLDAAAIASSLDEP
jgi:hypothetical protein